MMNSEVRTDDVRANAKAERLRPEIVEDCHDLYHLRG
jgi:hypothetical protein